MELEDLSVLELWCLRQVLRGSETEAASSRHETELEMARRLSEEGATKAAIGNSLFVTIKQSTSYEYDARGVKRLEEFLVGGGLVTQEDWDNSVQWRPKVNGHAVRRWMKLGNAVVGLIEQARMGASGKPQWDGPSFEQVKAQFPKALEKALAKLP